LFVTGISTINATDGKIPIGPLLGRDRAILKQGGFSDAEIAEWAATLDAQQMLRRHPEADNSYCRILGD
jgi:hypothetical protein